jgi:ankyrin repeat protein
VRIGCPTGQIIHIPRNIAVLKDNLSSSHVKRAFNIEELIDSNATSKATIAPDINPLASRLLGSIRMPFNSFSDIKVRPSHFSLLPVPNEAESMQIHAINKARKSRLSYHPSRNLSPVLDEKSSMLSTPFRTPYQHLAEQVPNSTKAFISAAKSGQTNEILLMLGKHKHLIGATDSLHSTALHWAVKRNDLTTVKVLLENGADIEARDATNRTPLMIALKLDFLEIVQELLKSTSKLAVTGSSFEVLKRLCMKNSSSLRLIEREEQFGRRSIKSLKSFS